VGGTAWTVPLVEVAVTVGEAPLEQVRTAVDSVLRGTDTDVRVTLIGPWDRLDPGRVPALTDPLLDLRLIAATYRGEPRVRLLTRPLTSAFPSPYLLEMSAGYGLRPDSVQRLIAVADQHQAGVVRVDGATDRDDLLLWRTAAVGRARWVRAADESLIDAVASTHGLRHVTAESAGVVDLTRFDADALAAGAAALIGGNRKRTTMATSVVEVEGARSLARAAVLVARLGGRRVRASLRGVMGRRSQRSSFAAPEAPPSGSSDVSRSSQP